LIEDFFSTILKNIIEEKKLKYQSSAHSQLGKKNQE
jgi:hypothetical protein